MKTRAKIMSEERLKRFYERSHYLTLGKLREFIERHKDLPDSTPILQERVEDAYFEGLGWDIYPVKGEYYHSTLKRNQEMRDEIKRREAGEEWKYPNLEDPSKRIFDPEEYPDEYIPVFALCYFESEGIIGITPHF